MCCYTLLPFRSSSLGHLKDSIYNCVLLITHCLSLSCSIVVIVLAVVVVVVGVVRVMVVVLVVVVVVVVVVVATSAAQRNLMRNIQKTLHVACRLTTSCDSAGV